GRPAAAAAGPLRGPAACRAAPPRSPPAAPGRAAAGSAATEWPRRARPRAPVARAPVSRLLTRRLVGRLFGRLGWRLGAVAVGLRHLALHGGDASARPLSQGRVRALSGDGLVGGQRRLPFLLLLAGEAQTGQGAETGARLAVGNAADRLEGLGGLREALLLQLA